uniref:EF-hand domain-containing protein n=1 Tax=Kalanchoe fedtschenkoi TaxID=63787 RepID=A0A7N0V309_KALFE
MSAASKKLDEVREVFNRFDANGDGLISSAELAGVLKALGSDSSADEISRMMEELDADRDGFINLSEFASFCKSANVAGAGSGDDGAGVRDAFDLYDKNGDGLISAAELHQVLNKLGESCSVQDCEKMIKSVDSDGDGNVSFDEFKVMMSNSKGNAA